MAVVVAQLAERSLPIPENPGMDVRIQSSATFIEHLLTDNCLRKDENKEKEAGNGPFFKKGKGPLRLHNS